MFSDCSTNPTLPSQKVFPIWLRAAIDIICGYNCRVVAVRRPSASFNKKQVHASRSSKGSGHFLHPQHSYVILTFSPHLMQSHFQMTAIALRSRFTVLPNRKRSRRPRKMQEGEAGGHIAKPL